MAQRYIARLSYLTAEEARVSACPLSSAMQSSTSPAQWSIHHMFAQTHATLAPENAIVRRRAPIMLARLCTASRSLYLSGRPATETKLMQYRLPEPSGKL